MTTDLETALALARQAQEQRFRQIHLARHPHCEVCLATGKEVPAVTTKGEGTERKSVCEEHLG